MNRIGITLLSIFLSRAFSSIVGGHRIAASALSTLSIEGLEVASGLRCFSVDSVGL